jgi:tetratricopeptide (TPR) repeat protein
MKTRKSAVPSRYPRGLLAALAAFTALWLGLVPQPASALAFSPTEAEWVMWPEYCRARYVTSAAGSDSGFAVRVSRGVVKGWETKLGQEVWYALHHYCAGIILSERARAITDPKRREYEQRNVIGEYAFTLDRTPSTHPIHADIAARMGLLYRDLGETEAALRYLDVAIDSCKSCAVGYLSKSMYFRTRGELAQARDVLQQGNEALGGESAEIHYFLGMTYAGLKDFDKAREHAREAYTRGYPLPGLRNQLAKAGHPIE